jgi:purine-cytosine permease-like protein
MLQKFATFILLVSFAVQVFNRVTIVADYYTNTAFYQKNCENITKPILKCNGKCQMAKKLKEEEKKDQQNPERRIDNKNEFFSNIAYTDLLILVPVLTEKKYFPLSSGIITSAPQSVFRPPSA